MPIMLRFSLICFSLNLVDAPKSSMISGKCNKNGCFNLNFIVGIAQIVELLFRIRWGFANSNRYKFSYKYFHYN